MKWSLAALWFCAALAAQPASVDGTVVNAAGNQPLAGVHVELIAMEAGGVKSAYGALSDRSGHFSITGIAADTYILLAERNGFLQARKPSDSPVPSLHLSPGQQLANLQIAMSARAVIAGRVVDEAGDPQPNVTVQASNSSDGAPLLLLRGALRVTTDDRGQFRIVAPPGRYYLKADAPADATGVPEIRSDGSTEAAYGATLYPTALEAVAGRDVNGIEIRLARQQSLTLGGAVTGAGGPAAAIVWLKSKENVRNVTTGANGRFLFGKLPAGAYRLFAQAAGQPGMQTQVLALDLNGRNEGNVQLLLSPGGELAGTLEMPPDAPAQKRAVRLDATGYLMGNAALTTGGAVGADGAFHMENVVPGRYKIRIEPLPSDGYVKAATLDGTALNGDILDFSRGVRTAKLKITVAYNGAQLSGAVVDSKGAPAAILKTAVLLITDPAEPLDAQIVQPDAGGKFKFEGIRPGKYRLLALDLLEIGGALDSDVTRALAAKAEEFEIKEGDRMNRNATVMVREESDAR